MPRHAAPLATWGALAHEIDLGRDKRKEFGHLSVTSASFLPRQDLNACCPAFSLELDTRRNHCVSNRLLQRFCVIGVMPFITTSPAIMMELNIELRMNEEALEEPVLGSRRI